MALADAGAGNLKAPPRQQSRRGRLCDFQETKTPTEEGKEAARARGRYGLLLLILITSYLLSTFFKDRWLSAVEIGLFTLSGLLALKNSPERSRLGTGLIIAGLLGSVAMIVLTASFTSDTGRGAAGLWIGLLLLITVVVLIRQILLMPAVTIQSIYGAVSAYLIIGLMFAAFYSAIFYYNNRHFFAAGEPGTTSTFQYFSFTTLTTLGYGDFTAVEPGGRSVAVIEAMTGQIFLATLVARLVATFTPRPGRSFRSNQTIRSDQSRHAGTGPANENLASASRRAQTSR